MACSRCFWLYPCFMKPLVKKSVRHSAFVPVSNARMWNASQPSRTQDTQVSRAALIWEAHQFLSRLVAGESARNLHISAPALLWLEERLLVHRAVDAAGTLHIHLTERGRAALLGRRASVVH